MNQYWKGILWKIQSNYTNDMFLGALYIDEITFIKTAMKKSMSVPSDEQ